jgi:hypothetical protein
MKVYIEPKMTYFGKNVFVIVLGLLAGLNNNVFSQDTITIMTYNLLNFTENSNNRTDYFKTVIDFVNPDILVVQEIVSQQASDLFYSGALNNEYSSGTFIDGFDSDNAVFYKHSFFTFINNIPINTELRDINQFTLVTKNTNDTLLIYSCHLKSSSGTTNEQKRASEIDSLRNVTNLLSPGKYFIACGDFNFYKSTEPAYQKLLFNDGINEGHFYDPITITGNWNNGMYAQYHTQSTRIRQFGGGATGGLDDRFDLMLYSQGIANSGGMDYIANSAWAVGNDGNHYNDSINKQPNTSIPVNVATALHNASDHLPVVSCFVFEKVNQIKLITLNLKKGWNGVSSYLEPLNTNIDTITKNLGECLITIQKQTQTYYPDSSNNSLTQWDYQSGYFIKVSSDTSFTFQGTTPIINSITLLSGWNLISVLSEEPLIIEDVFKGYLNDIVIIKEAVGVNLYWPQYQIQSLKYILSKKTYYILFYN